MVKPNRIYPGGTIAAVTLSWGGPGTFPSRYEIGKKQLETEFGVHVVEMTNTLRDADWLYKHPQARADDLMRAFSDPTIKAIFSAIGGDDSIRILPYLDLDVIRSNPKIFMGFSDTTISHMACYKAGLTTFYGPSIMAGFAENGGLFPYMISSVRKTLFSADPIGVVSPNRSGWTCERLDWAEPANQTCKRTLNPSRGWNFLQGTGIHHGHLLGGCLEVLDWLRGTPFFPGKEKWHSAILFLDMSEESPSPTMVYQILRTFGAMGILENLSGIIVGRPYGENSPDTIKKHNDVILQVIRDELGLTKLPIITQMDFGHTEPVFVLPYGAQAEIDCDKQIFSIVENAVN